MTFVHIPSRSRSLNGLDDFQGSSPTDHLLRGRDEQKVRHGGRRPQGRRFRKTSLEIGGGRSPAQPRRSSEQQQVTLTSDGSSLTLTNYGDTSF